MRETAVEMAKRLLVDSIWRAANVEGLGTTFARTENILANVPVTTTREEVFFVVNMKRAWNFLLDNVDYPPNLMFVRELNKICGEGLFQGNGEIRTTGVRIGGTNYVPEIPHSGVVAENLRRINDIEDPVDRALEAFCYMSRTQAFVDGNKRVSQLLANQILISSNVGVLGIPVDENFEFKDKLVRFYETNDSKDLKSFLEGECIAKVSSVINRTTDPVHVLEEKLTSIEHSDKILQNGMAALKNGMDENAKELQDIKATVAHLKNESAACKDEK